MIGPKVTWRRRWIELDPDSPLATSVTLCCDGSIDPPLLRGVLENLTQSEHQPPPATRTHLAFVAVAPTNLLSALDQVRSDLEVSSVIVGMQHPKVEERVRALDHGADYVMASPFAPREVLSRFRALHRRLKIEHGDSTTVGALTLDHVTRSARSHGKIVELSLREFSLLKFMLERPGVHLSRAAISDQVWEDDCTTGSNIIAVYVSYLRRKLAQLGLSPLRTLRGRGYLLDPAMCREPQLALCRRLPSRASVPA